MFLATNPAATMLESLVEWARTKRQKAALDNPLLAQEGNSKSIQTQLGGEPGEAAPLARNVAEGKLDQAMVQKPGDTEVESARQPEAGRCGDLRL